MQIIETNSENISLFRRGGVYYIGRILSDSAWTQYAQSSNLSYIKKIWQKSYKLF